jgi:sterol desaturase/sphingolipid hydroxylase (fatty acid hydroxylase superfamily)
MGVIALVLGVALAMMVVEHVVPGRNWPRVRGWWTRALLLNGVQAACVVVGSVTWNRGTGGRHLLDLDRLGPVAGALVGYLVMTFVYYWWHRWRHESEFLWRWFHQVHHSAQRIEIITSFYKHPFEIVANALLSSTLLSAVLGLGTEAAAGVVVLSGIAELVYHWNVATPRWLGYLFQRPESHCLHHQEGVHSYNYADLPLWDMLFGTFRNPGRWQGRCGFGDDEHELAAMLAGSLPEPARSVMA